MGPERRFILMKKGTFPQESYQECMTQSYGKREDRPSRWSSLRIKDRNEKANVRLLLNSPAMVSQKLQADAG